MRRAVLMTVAAFAVGCGEEATEPGGGIALAILSPTAEDSIYDLDPLLLMGTATSASVGILPDDSVWWTDDGDTLGRGTRIEARAHEGSHAFVLHARYGPAEDSTSLTLIVLPGGLGRVLWTVPLEPQLSDGLAMLPDGRLVARGGRSSVAILGRDGSVLERYDFARQLAEAAVTALPDGSVMTGFVVGGYPLVNGYPPGGILEWTPGGAIDWEFDLGDEGTGAHHVHGGVTADGAGNAYFVSGEREEPVWSFGPGGTRRWRTETQSSTGGLETFGWTVLVGDSLVVVELRRDSVVALSTSTGAIRWIVGGGPGGGYGRFLPAVDGCGTVYVAGRDAGLGYPALVAISPSGNVGWRIPVQGYPANPVVGSNRVYVGSVNGSVLAISFDGATQDTLGPALITGVQAGMTIGRNDVLYVAGSDTLYSLTADGMSRFAVPIPVGYYGYDIHFGPVIGADGTVYLRTADGVAAFRDTVGPSTDAPWPTAQGNFQRTGRVATSRCGVSD